MTVILFNEQEKKQFYFSLFLISLPILVEISEGRMANGAKTVGTRSIRVWSSFLALLYIPHTSMPQSNIKAITPIVKSTFCAFLN